MRMLWAAFYSFVHISLLRAALTFAANNRRVPACWNDGVAGSPHMKGIVFTEFFDMVEQQHGLATVERLLEAVRPENAGAYTAVGNYDHMEMVGYVGALARSADQSMDAILTGFGEHLFGVFVRRFPDLIRSANSAIEFLAAIESSIHVEVLKLYPDAELPRFEYALREADRLSMVYRSRRPLAPFAHGLIRGCIAHFGDPLDVRMRDLSDGQGTAAQFDILPVAA